MLQACYYQYQIVFRISPAYHALNQNATPASAVQSMGRQEGLLLSCHSQSNISWLIYRLRHSCWQNLLASSFQISCWIPHLATSFPDAFEFGSVPLRVLRRFAESLDTWDLRSSKLYQSTYTSYSAYLSAPSAATSAVWRLSEATLSHQEILQSSTSAQQTSSQLCSVDFSWLTPWSSELFFLVTLIVEFDLNWAEWLWRSQCGPLLDASYSTKHFLSSVCPPSRSSFFARQRWLSTASSHHLLLAWESSPDWQSNCSVTARFQESVSRSGS